MWISSNTFCFNFISVLFNLEGQYPKQKFWLAARLSRRVDVSGFTLRLPRVTSSTVCHMYVHISTRYEGGSRETNGGPCGNDETYLSCWGEGRGRADFSSKSGSERLNVSASIWPWLISNGYNYYNAIQPVHWFQTLENWLMSQLFCLLFLSECIFSDHLALWKKIKEEENILDFNVPLLT